LDAREVKPLKGGCGKQPSHALVKKFHRTENDERVDTVLSASLVCL
jgi:hypothetical protein